MVPTRFRVRRGQFGLPHQAARRLQSCHPGADGAEVIEARVHPDDDSAARVCSRNVDGAMNAVAVRGRMSVGPTLYYGAGAGAQLPTASAVVGDLPWSWRGRRSARGPIRVGCAPLGYLRRSRASSPNRYSTLGDLDLALLRADRARWIVPGYWLKITLVHSGRAGAWGSSRCCSQRAAASWGELGTRCASWTHDRQGVCGERGTGARSTQLADVVSQIEPGGPHRAGALAMSRTPRRNSQLLRLVRVPGRPAATARWPLTEVIYTLPEVRRPAHGRARHGGCCKKRSAEEWKTRCSRERTHSTEWPYGSGVWGKRELVCPLIDDDNVVSMYEGNTNLFWARALRRASSGCRRSVAQALRQHAYRELQGSGHDRAGQRGPADASRRARNIPAVACASTGDTSAALAAYAAVRGHPGHRACCPRTKVSMPN